jgi:membrane-anchored protein YejM (alkaline phosphatase superfamily)
LSDGLGKKIIEKLKSKFNEPWCLYIHANDLHFPVDVVKEFDNEKFGISKYERMISSIDSWIGKIYDNINLKNTLFIITGDHGIFIPSVTTENEIINFEVDSEKQQLVTKISKKTPSFLQPLKTKIFIKKEKKERDSKIKKILKMDLKPSEKKYWNMLILI